MIECRLVASHGLWYELSGGRASDFADLIDSRFKLIPRLMDQSDYNGTNLMEGRRTTDVNRCYGLSKRRLGIRDGFRVCCCVEVCPCTRHVSTKPQPRWRHDNMKLAKFQIEAERNKLLFQSSPLLLGILTGIKPGNCTTTSQSFSKKKTPWPMQYLFWSSSNIRSPPSCRGSWDIQSSLVLFTRRSWPSWPHPADLHPRDHACGLHALRCGC